MRVISIGLLLDPERRTHRPNLESDLRSLFADDAEALYIFQSSVAQALSLLEITPQDYSSVRAKLIAFRLWTSERLTNAVASDLKGPDAATLAVIAI